MRKLIYMYMMFESIPEASNHFQRILTSKYILTTRMYVYTHFQFKPHRTNQHRTLQTIRRLKQQNTF